MTNQSWRDRLPVHPAADRFPLLSREELQALANDIGENGLQHGITVLRDATGTNKDILIDGRNRLDALEHLGGDIFDKAGRVLKSYVGKVLISSITDEDDLAGYVASLNIHRRHLTGEQRRELIARLLKADPAKSNRSIAVDLHADHKTVGAVRGRLEATGEIPQLAETEGKDGRFRPAKPVPAPTIIPLPKVPSVRADKASQRALKAASNICNQLDAIVGVLEQFEEQFEVSALPGNEKAKIAADLKRYADTIAAFAAKMHSVDGATP